ncbi:MAG: DUF1259 domain-containing protein [Bryobacteraceae bacterium]
MSRLAACLFLLSLPAFGTFPDAVRNAVDQITGLKGVYVPSEDVYKIGFPRSDVKVTVDRAAMQSFMGLMSWAAFTTGTMKEAMVTGELLLFEDEVNPVLSAALDNGLEVTALHNHFLFDSPRMMFLHITGEGRGADLARGVRKCMDKVKEVRTAAPVPASQFPGAEIPGASSISAPPIDKILGFKGQSADGMYKATVERHARMYGREVGGQMGANTWAAFAGTDDHALVDGEFAVTSAELQNVLKILRASGLQVVAIHNHMTHEEPQFVFLHYWGKGTSAKLAKTIRAAMDKQAAAVSAHIGHPVH